MLFGSAITALKKGSRVRRKGWPAGEMLAFLPEIVEIPAEISTSFNEAFKLPADSPVEMVSTIAHRAADGTINVNWLPSGQADLLASDWMEVK
jgi:hypothetical protein